MINQVLASTILEKGKLFKVIAAHSIEQRWEGNLPFVTCHSIGLQYDIIQLLYWMRSLSSHFLPITP
jgi:hypothetical protein